MPLCPRDSTPIRVALLSCESYVGKLGGHELPGCRAGDLRRFLRMRVQIALQVAAASLMAGACFAAAPAAAAGGALAPHRAVYDLKLLKSHGRRSVEAG